MHVIRCTIVETLPVFCELLSTLFPHILKKLNATPCHLFSFIETLAWIFLFSIAQHKLLQQQHSGLYLHVLEQLAKFCCKRKHG